MLDAIIITSTLLVLFVQITLALKQLLKLMRATLNEQIKIVTPTEEEFKKTKNYNTAKLCFSIFNLFINTAITIYVVKTGFYIKLAKLIQNQGYPRIPSEIAMALLSSYIFQILAVPLSAFDTFVIEEKFGFNKTTLKTFISDLFLGMMLLSVITPPILVVVLKLIFRYPDTFFIHVTIALIVFQLFILIIAPDFIMPLFNKFEKLADGPLKERIEALAKKLNFRHTAILQCDGSKRSHHSNAYFMGLFKEKRIVLFDTLLRDLEEEEIMAVLAHEFGHWAKKHVWAQIGVSCISLSMSIILLNIFTRFRIPVHGAILGAKDTLTMLQFFYFNLSLTALSPFLTLLSNMYTRKLEREADKFAVNLGYGANLKLALIKLHSKNCSNVVPDKFYSTYHHSHPTLFERLEKIDEEIKKME